MLAWTLYISLLGVAVLMLLPRGAARPARMVALLTAVVGFVIALAGCLTLDPGKLNTITRVPWIPSLGIEYHLAADGVSLTLVLLTGIAAVAGILFSWNIEHRAKEFFAFYLALIAGVYGALLPIFYQDYLGLSAWWITLASAIYAVWNAINDPLFGYITDGTRSKHGRRIPYMRYQPRSWA